LKTLYYCETERKGANRLLFLLLCAILPIMKVIYVESHYYGQPIEWNEDHTKWRYIDGGDFDKDKSSPPRSCPKCNKIPDENGHDPCIKDLPGVRFACCGHGVGEGYIFFEDGRVIRFDNMYRDDHSVDPSLS